MTLQHWETNGWLRPHKTSHREIANLLRMVERDLKDSEGNISADWRFGIAYNAALRLCTILLYAQGYRPSHGAHHFRAIQAMPLILGSIRTPDAEYLDACRNKRNVVEYEYIGAATDDDAAELLDFVKRFHKEVVDWLGANHPHLLPK